MSPEQIAAIEVLARDLLIIEPQDRKAAILLMVDGYAKAVRADYPDLPEGQIENAVSRFGNAIMQRFNELNVVGEGHA